MRGRYGVSYQYPVHTLPPALQPQLSEAERADLAPREGEDLVRYFQRVGLPKAGERGPDAFAPVLPDFTSEITPGERYLFSQYGDPLEREHQQYGESVDRVLSMPLVPRRLVEVQLGLGTQKRADEFFAENLGDYEGGDLTPLQYLRLSPHVQAAQAIRTGDEETYLKMAELREDPTYAADVVYGAVQQLKATGGKQGDPQSAFAVGSLLNALERGGPQGEYADEASVTESEWKGNLEAGGSGARYALMSGGAQQNARRQVAGEFLRAMQDGDYRPKSATWVSNTLTTGSAALGDMSAGERANIQNFNSPFAYRAYVANEALRNSQLLNGGPRSIFQNGTMAVDRPYTWDGIAAVMSRNPQYPAAGAVQPVNSFLRNMGTILDKPASQLGETAGTFAYMDNRFSRTQPLRPDAQTPAQSDQDRLEALRYNQAMQGGYYGAAIEPYTNAGWNKMRRIVGLEEQPRQLPWRATEMAVAMPDAFKSNVYSAGMMALPILGGGGGAAGAAARAPVVVAGEVVDELRADLGLNVLETGSPFRSLSDLFSSPQSNAYARVPGKGLLGREMMPLSPSQPGYDQKKKEAEQYYDGVFDRQRQAYRMRGQ
jgi:hypothetical protein